MKKVTREQWDFVAKYLGDISKAIFAVALASKLFGDLKMWVRITLPVVGIAALVTAFLVLPKGAKHD